MMSRTLTEQKVLNKLDIEDFRHLTKDKVITMVSMLDKMDPEVAKKALEQFPEFAKTTKEMLVEYMQKLDKGLEENSESVQKCYDTYGAIILSLQKELEKENLSFEEKKYIIEQMKEIADKVDKKDSENKKFIWAMSGMGMLALTGAVAILASALGGNTQIETDDIKKLKP